MSFDYDEPIDPDTAAAVAADIGNSLIPDKESDADRELRLAVFQLEQEFDRQRRADAQERAEFDRQREQERQQQVAHAEARRAWREKADQQAREREAQHDRAQLASLVQH